MSAAQLLVGALVFTQEIWLWAAVGVIGYRLAGGGVAGWALAALAVVLVITAWGRWIAPRSEARLPLWPRVGVIVALTAAAGAGLALTGSRGAGIALATLGSLVQVVGQPMHEAD
ncbi:MAG: YrdB family protein [Micrococcales bacterium]|nr:YrdB family protein [Micrococcales bacterium]